jgi:hypothetical protein
MQKVDKIVSKLEDDKTRVFAAMMMGWNHGPAPQ